jgi:hypothetical protein
LDVGDVNKGYQSSQLSSHNLKMPLQSELCNDTMKTEDFKKGQRIAQLIQEEMTKSFSDGGKSQIINGFDVMKYIRPYAFKEKGDNNLLDEDETSTPNTYEDIKDIDDMIIPKSMSEVYNLSNVNRRRANKDKSPKTSDEKDGAFEAEKFPEDDIDEAEKILASRGGPCGYFGDNKRQKPNSIPPGKEGDIELMIKMGWIKSKDEAEALAASSNTNTDQGEVESKKGDSTKLSKESGRGAAPLPDYYSTMGAGIGAYDPNAPPSNNPFFQGAAAGAASLFTGEKHKNKSGGKRNKKR